MVFILLQSSRSEATMAGIRSLLGNWYVNLFIG